MPAIRWAPRNLEVPCVVANGHVHDRNRAIVRDIDNCTPSGVDLKFARVAEMWSFGVPVNGLSSTAIGCSCIVRHDNSEVRPDRILLRRKRKRDRFVQMPTSSPSSTDQGASKVCFPRKIANQGFNPSDPPHLTVARRRVGHCKWSAWHISSEVTTSTNWPFQYLYPKSIGNRAATLPKKC